MLILRKYTHEDGKKITPWLKDERSFRLWCADRFENFPLCADTLDRFYQENSASVQGFIAVDNGETIGHLFIQKLDPVGISLKFGLIIIDDSKRGKGYGKQMLQAALSLAFDKMNAESVSLCVFDNNYSAEKCYKDLGFVKTGKYTVHSFFGENWKYCDMILKKQQ